MDLGLSSLQLVELRLLLEERGGVAIDGERLAACESIGDLVHLVESDEPLVRESSTTIQDDDEGLQFPEWLSDMGRKGLGRLQHSIYQRAFNVKVKGREHIPRNEQVLIISNHSSHLDMGLVKYALGDYAPNLSALAASDYFFDTQYNEILLNHSQI